MENEFTFTVEPATENDITQDDAVSIDNAEIPDNEAAPEYFENAPAPLLEENENRELKVRLDKWLWAARFYKTRALARSAVEQGFILYNGERSNPSREIQIGALLTILGKFEKTVVITGLSTRRRSAQEATGLFKEVPLNNMQHNNRRGKQHAHNPFRRIVKKQQPTRKVRFLRRAVVRGENKPENSNNENNNYEHNNYEDNYD